MAEPANDNVEGGSHEVDPEHDQSQQRQWPQITTAATEVAVSLALLVLTWALFAFAFAMEG